MTKCEPPTFGGRISSFGFRLPRGSEKRRRFILSFSTLTSESVSDSIERVKWLGLFALLALEFSCTTPANRRDLYSPQPDPDLDWHRQIPTTSHAAEETVPPAAIR